MTKSIQSTRRCPHARRSSLHFPAPPPRSGSTTFLSRCPASTSIYIEDRCGRLTCAIHTLPPTKRLPPASGNCTPHRATKNPVSMTIGTSSVSNGSTSAWKAPDEPSQLASSCYPAVGCTPRCGTRTITTRYTHGDLPSSEASGSEFPPPPPPPPILYSSATIVHVY